ncbi:hypothetical protein E2C01_027092 [Portunus trituberculatus]|uniref:Uncharacterized protein n=1 Tax=Portunus trituberculatus TaxID=210409 RepID=A0A5B7EL15_PORTR|nr:hypothetical protein [Portunus trituberculatus]
MPGAHCVAGGGKARALRLMPPNNALASYRSNTHLRATFRQALPSWSCRLTYATPTQPSPTPWRVADGITPVDPPPGRVYNTDPPAPTHRCSTTTTTTTSSSSSSCTVHAIISHWLLVPSPLPNALAVSTSHKWSPNTVSGRHGITSPLPWFARYWLCLGWWLTLRDVLRMRPPLHKSSRPSMTITSRASFSSVCNVGMASVSPKWCPAGTITIASEFCDRLNGSTTTGPL